MDFWLVLQLGLEQHDFQYEGKHMLYKIRTVKIIYGRTNKKVYTTKNRLIIKIELFINQF